MSAHPRLRRLSGHQILRRISRLDPEREFEEVVRLTLEVLYGDPKAVHAGLLVGFIRQAAVPSIARILYRGGNGDTLRDVGTRNDDTLALFGAMLHFGPSSPHGRAAIRRMESIHARFPITDEQKRYTLSTLLFEGERTARHLRINAYTPAQLSANWHFWRAVAAEMPLGGLPDTPAAYWQWMLDYEHERWAYTPGGRALVDSFFHDWTTRWFPPRLRWLGRQALLTLLDDRLRTVHQLEAPNKHLERLLRANIRLASRLTPIRRVPVDRSWLDYFGRGSGAPPNFDQIGHRGEPVITPAEPSADPPSPEAPLEASASS